MPQVWVNSRGIAVRCSAAAHLALTEYRLGCTPVEIARSLERQLRIQATPGQALAFARTALDRVENVPVPERNPYRSLLLRVEIMRAPLVAAVSDRIGFLVGGRSAALTILMAACILAVGLPRALTSIRSASFETWIAALPIFLASALAHEIGHAAVAKRFGVAPGPVGAGLFVVFPVFFADVSAVWALSRRQRALVDLGGVHIQLLVAAGCMACLLVHRSPVLGVAFTMILLGVAASANPFFRNDGYWLMADLLDRPFLQRDAWSALRRSITGRGQERDPLVFYAALEGLLAAAALLTVTASLLRSIESAGHGYALSMTDVAKDLIGVLAGASLISYVAGLLGADRSSRPRAKGKPGA